MEEWMQSVERNCAFLQLIGVQGMGEVKVKVEEILFLFNRVALVRRMIRFFGSSGQCETVTLGRN